ncbi:MAG: hypothetical protein OEY07_18780 [Gammaproteobacteria bacterium]|nr:hypothetical protein [Gammaproteobacteria bacterium]
MRGFVPIDPETDVSQERFAVIHTPRPTRKRFPAGCVEIVEDAASAIQNAKTSEQLHAARVIGPSKSSEGQFIYYLVEWLT